MNAGTQEHGTERGTEDAKYAIMNAHAHILKAHMVIGATAKLTCSDQSAKSVCQLSQFVSQACSSAKYVRQPSLFVSYRWLKNGNPRSQYRSNSR